MYTKLLLVALAVLPMFVDSTPTHCDGWKSYKEFRCAKDNYRADSIHIRNIVNHNIRVGKWMSQCGWAGVSYSSGERYLGPGESNDEFFSEAQGLACNELFIYACKQDGRDVNCVNILTPSVN